MKKPPEDLAQKLLAAADAAAEGAGFDLSVDEIAKVAEVPRATLYYYFSGRDDLVQFFINDKLERMATAIEKAAATEGSPTERLERILRSILEGLAAYPRMCVELPGIVKDLGEYESVMANAERWVLAPMREVLIEGRATKEFAIADPGLTSVALMGALNMVGMMQIVQTGELRAAETADMLVPELLNGVVAG